MNLPGFALTMMIAVTACLAFMAGCVALASGCHDDGRVSLRAWAVFVVLVALTGFLEMLRGGLS